MVTGARAGGAPPVVATKVARRATVIVVPSGDTIGLPIGVMSPACPVKLTVAPGANRLPLSVSGTDLTALGSVVALPGSTVASTGVVTVNGALLLSKPLTATVTPPVVACDGTVTVRAVDVAAVTVAATLTPLAPAKVTELFVAVALKPEPLIVTLLPIGPEIVKRLVMLGGGGGGDGVPLEGGAASPAVASTLTSPKPVAEPPSGLVTVTL